MQIRAVEDTWTVKGTATTDSVIVWSFPAETTPGVVQSAVGSHFTADISEIICMNKE